MTSGAVRGMWRHLDRLPVRSAADVVSLGEGDTPLLDLSARLADELGIASIVAKAEDRNPTGSFKARIASVAYSLVRERGLGGGVGTSSGNGGAAAAAYAAAGGSRAVLFTLSDTVADKLREILAAGGVAFRVRGVGHDAASTVRTADLIAEASRSCGMYPLLTGFRYAPEAMAGVATIAWELQEQAPDLTHLYLPVGGGGLLTGVHLGYGGTGPRLVGVQPTGAAALVRALEGNPDGIAGRVTTEVSGLQMAALYDHDGAVGAIRGSGGHVVAVTDEEIREAQRLLAGVGLLVEPAGAAAFAGVRADGRAGRLQRGDRVGIVLTGAGHKDGAALARLAGTADVPLIDCDDVADVLASAVAGVSS